ncbi:MAG TPA: DUF4382 domain-containing protein [Candidatus Baltobacteraceae bacterium]|nr:DUF4382 domain-containing protein [Candidatus Baltobacteraceae bacterium]
MDNRGIIGVIIAVIVIVAAITYIGSMPSKTGGAVGSAKNGTVAILLTDPPQVPAGTQSLVVSYSSVQVHTNTAGTGQPNLAWISASGSGSINLLSILNLSQTIAAASIANGSTVDMVRFNVTSARIMINGTAYNVTVPSGRVTAHVSENARVNGTTGLLLQMSPTVASIFTSNSTVFVLVPSVKAIAVGSTVQTQVGSTVKLSAEDSARLNESTPNMTMTSESLSVAGNSTVLSVTVKDNSNQSVMLKHLTIFGNFTVILNNSAIANATNGVMSQLLTRLKNESFCGNASAISSVRVRSGENGSVEVTNESVNSSIRGELAVQDRPEFAANLNISAGANGSANASSGEQHMNGTNSTERGNANATASSNESLMHENESVFQSHDFGDFHTQLNASSCNVAALQAIADQAQANAEDFGNQIARQQEHFRMLPMLITSGGKLMIASSGDSFDNSSVGYNLSAGQSLTLNFSGPMLAAQGHMVIVPQAGRSYVVAVSGEEGAFVKANITATSG